MIGLDPRNGVTDLNSELFSEFDFEIQSHSTLWQFDIAIENGL